MKKQEQILREEIRRTIRQILEAEEDEMPEEDPEMPEEDDDMPEEEPEEEPEEDVDYADQITKLSSKYLAKLKKIPTSDEPDNIIIALTKIVGGFGLSKDEVMPILKGVRNSLSGE
jgi:hypothetical protein